MTRANIPELLAPAGSPAAAAAAVQAGADAVYLAGRRFGARGMAENFSGAQLEAAIDYCHVRGVAAYIAVNTMLKDGELTDAAAFCRAAYAAGADAFIVSDYGFASFLRAELPGVKLHASTQMTAHGAGDAAFLSRIFDRVILARELSFEEIADIVKKSPERPEIEVFAHGALCVSYSGQCQFSGALGGRSGNRGLCAQSCRQFYEMDGAAGHLLSTRDICLLDALPRLAGVAAIKIEGRMKSPEYVYAVTRLYRRGLDKLRAGDMSPPSAAEMNEALQAFNRGGGFSRGYADNYAGRAMMSGVSPKSAGVRVGAVTRTAPDGRCEVLLTAPLAPGDGLEFWTKKSPHPGTGVNKAYAAGQRAVFTVKGPARGDAVFRTFDKTFADNIKRDMDAANRRRDVACNVRAAAGEPLTLELEYGIRVAGETVQNAQNNPLPKERLLQQLMKTGGTPFNLIIQNADIGDNIFINMGAVNALRREALERLEAAIIAAGKRPAPVCALRGRNSPAPTPLRQSLIAQIWTPAQFDAAMLSEADAVYAPARLLLSPAKPANPRNIPIFAVLPPITADPDELAALLRQLNDLPVAGFLAANYGQLAALSAPEFAGKTVAADYGFNAANALTFNALAEYADYVTASTELNLRELAAFTDGRAELVVHGRQRLMLTRQCPVGLYASGKQSGRFCALRDAAKPYALRDQKGFTFPVLTDCGACLAYIFNSKILCTLNKLPELAAAPFGRARLVFTNESPADCLAVINAYARAFGGGAPDEDTLRSLTEAGVTNGQFFRGVL